MKYAAEVIDLLAANQGRHFKMAEIVRHVTKGRELSGRERNAVRQAVLRVLSALLSEKCLSKVNRKKCPLYFWVNGFRGL